MKISLIIFVQASLCRYTRCTSRNLWCASRRKSGQQKYAILTYVFKNSISDTLLGTKKFESGLIRCRNVENTRALQIRKVVGGVWENKLKADCPLVNLKIEESKEWAADSFGVKTIISHFTPADRIRSGFSG